MPLVRISMVTGRTHEERKVIGNCVHEALVEAIGIPADDRFQVVTEYGYEESAADEAPRLNMFWDPHYLGIERTRAISLLVSTRNSIEVWLFLGKKPRRALTHCRHRK
jgi:4-oxalocrotonate tautomerase